MTYPVVTKENFEEITKKHVRNAGVFRSAYLKGLPVPKTRQEFFEMTQNMYGVGLGVTGRVYGKGGSYKIEADQSKYAREEIAALWDKKYSQYDGLKAFLCFTFNSVTCGGVAGSHYGQFKTKGHRHKLRLQKFWESEFVPSESKVQK